MATFEWYSTWQLQSTICTLKWATYLGLAIPIYLTPLDISLTNCKLPDGVAKLNYLRAKLLHNELLVPFSKHLALTTA